MTTANDRKTRELTAFRTRNSQVQIEPAPRWRDWMHATSGRSANKCLPMLVANESGWVLLNPVLVTATWNGSHSADGISFEYPSDRRHAPGEIASHFGHGVLTFRLPFLFRTPPGYNLLARGPANWPKDGICALEGLVETDWSVATFTMNWKFTRPDHPVAFEEGEPFCMVVPQRRGELESFQPEIRPLESDPATHEETRSWQASRHSMQVNKFLSQYSTDHEEYRRAWEADYFKGRKPGGEKEPEHQTKLRLRDFNRQA